jgi:SAM-dependent methyltransferase
MKMDLPLLYTDLAWIWPVISPPAEYQREARMFRREIVRLLQPRPKQRLSLLHLGCGGGHLDWYFNKKFTVTGVDLSQPMLDLARRLNPEVEYLQGDMRSLRLRRLFDTVVIADSIDYMLDEAELAAAFNTAYAHLRPGGVFLTYAEDTRERFEQNASYCFTEMLGNVEISVFQNTYDPDPADTTIEKTFVYLIRQDGQLSIHTDRHLCGLFGQATWLECLEQAGFQVQVKTTPYGDPMFIGIKP